MDYQAIADKIELVLASLSSVSDEELRDLAETYAKACQEVNQRLQDIHHLIKGGERSEAIRRADIAPRLLDAVDILDLPDRDAWVDICTLKRLPQPPELLTQYVAELNEAYESEQGLAGLVRQHRLLALARAPLAKRAAVLRQLAEAEPENPVWVEDLQMLERFWLDQISQEIQDHLKAEDLFALEETLKELESGEWRCAPPATVISQCRSAVEMLRGKAFRREMEHLAELIREAMERRDLPRVEELLRVWQERAATAPQWVDWELQNKVQPAMLLAKQLEADRQAERRRRQLFNQFQQMLVNPSSRAELQKQYLALQELGVTLPPDVEDRYAAVMDMYRRRAALWRNILLVVMALVFIAVGVVVWTVQAQIRTNHLAANAVAAVEAYIAGNRFKEAEDYLAELEKKHPQLLERPELIAIKTRLEEARQEEESRQKKFANLLSMIESSLESVPNAPALEQATSLARTPEEKERVASLKAQAEKRWAALRAEAEEEFRKRINQLEGDLNRIVHSNNLSVEEELQQLSQLSDRIKRLETENRDKGLAFDRELNQLRDRAAARLMEVAKTSKKERAIRELCSAAAQGTEAYLAAVRRIAASADSAGLTDLAMVEGELPRLDALPAWNNAASLWNDPRTVLSVQVRTTLVEQVNSLQVDPVEAFPLKLQERQKLETYLASISRRDQLALTAVPALNQEWKQPLISDAWLVQLKNGRRYYSREQPVKVIKVVRSLKGGEDDVLPIIPNMVAYQGRAPHTVLYNRVEKALADWSPSSWETCADTVLSEIIRFSRKEPPELPEPPLLFHLFWETLTVAKDGDLGWEAFWKASQESLQKLRDQYPANYDWPRVAQENTSNFDDLRSFFDKLPPPEEILKQVAAAREEYRAIPWPGLKWVGIVLEDEQRVWYVRPIGSENMQDGTPLFILEPPPGGQGLFLKRIGMWKGQRGVVERAGSVRLYNGRPVVAFVPPSRN
ncbi:hypothetical protein [Thermogutta sp.]|uniref:hypothetical protein n=1 Tax=Thermogutta sp. TaxID=1962930 RepID=UPI003C7E55A3